MMSRIGEILLQSMNHGLRNIVRFIEAQGDLDRAIASFERALRLDPGLGEAREGLARARAQRGGDLP